MTDLSPTSAEASLAPQLRLQRLISGYTTSQVIYVAAKLGLADLLSEGPRTVAELAAATGTEPEALARFLRAMAAISLLADAEGGRFQLGSLGVHLRTSAPGSLRNFAIHAGEEQYQAWGRALYSVQTGRPAFDAVYNSRFYDHITADPERAEIWNRSMDETERAWIVELGLVDSYRWDGVRRVVDVGGGRGVLLGAILAANEALRGTLYDLPSVVSGARDVLDSVGISERCQVVGGDFFESVPAGGDLYLLSRVLFNWDDRDAVRILGRCREAMREGTRLLVIEPVVTQQPGDLATLVDLNVFLVCGGRVRAEAEHVRLMHAAGFELRRVIATPAAWGIIEGFAV